MHTCSVTGIATIVSHLHLTSRSLRYLTVVLTMLSIACTHVDTQFVMPFRLWQTQLQQKYPIWAAADVAPKNNGTWKELVAIATKLEAPAAPDLCLDLHRRFKVPSGRVQETLELR